MVLVELLSALALVLVVAVLSMASELPTVKVSEVDEFEFVLEFGVDVDVDGTAEIVLLLLVVELVESVEAVVEEEVEEEAFVDVRVEEIRGRKRHLSVRFQAESSSLPIRGSPGVGLIPIAPGRYNGHDLN